MLKCSRIKINAPRSTSIFQEEGQFYKINPGNKLILNALVNLIQYGGNIANAILVACEDFGDLFRVSHMTALLKTLT